MSGTSLDGIDAALVELTPRGRGYDLVVRAAQTFAFDEPTAAALRAALPPHQPAPAATAALDVRLGRALGLAAQAIAGAATIDFVASHGLTLYHDGPSGRTVQIGDPFVIREVTGTTVVSDFRRADCAAGGEGAPLVPYVDALLFTADDETTIALNLGGIANISILPAGSAPESVRGWDCGPGNMVLDGFVAERTGGRECFDRNGAHAAAGTIDSSALEALYADPYFLMAPPKSTGREYFGAPFLARHAKHLAALSLEDGCATLAALTATAIARDVRMHAPAYGRLIVSGGGAHNPTLLAALGRELPGYSVRGSDAFGIDVDAKEAIAFAVLGYETLRDRPAGLPPVTGARRPALLGAIAPRGLLDLLTRIAAEVAASGST